MNNDNVIKKGKVIVGGTLREKLKAKLKDLIRKQMKEISASGAAGGSSADGSAGPIKTPYAFGKVKDPTTGLDGYKQVGKNETGTITEKEGKKKKDEKEAPKKSEPKPYVPIVSEPVLPPKERLKQLQSAASDAANAAADASDAATKATNAAKKVTKLATARKKQIQAGDEDK